MPKISENQVVNSALWAAFGDAAGFPTELVSLRELERRIGTPRIEGPVEWSRRLGGMFGPEVTLPAGTYSDDTQLRLAVSRAITGNGFFDVESFAKIELPVWLNYAHGAGRASKLAAANLALRDSTWSNNFFHNGRVEYWNGGGNGAAMRVQPHVWVAHNHGPEAFMSDVIRDAVCTHGHPRALIGAAAHAHALHLSLLTQRLPSPDEWEELGSVASAQAYRSLLDDQELSLVWVPQWEQLSGTKLKKLWDTTTAEWVEASRTAAAACRTMGTPLHRYRTVLNELGGFTAAERGSGLKTALYANVLAWLYSHDGPVRGLLAAANELGSDTDTIATMAGAMMGAVCPGEPQSPIQDRDYIAGEARRLFAIGAGRDQGAFPYPDLMSWSAPRAQTDAWLDIDDTAVLAGLGALVAAGPGVSAPKGPRQIYQWCALPFGQTVLAKRKASARPPAAPEVFVGQGPTSATHEEASPVTAGTLASKTFLPPSETGLLTAPDLHTLTRECIQKGFQAEDIGRHLLALMSGPEGIERAIAFTAIIAKAKLARDQR